MTRLPLPMLDMGNPATGDPDDPVELVAVPIRVDDEAFDEMGRCLIEEYVRDGWSDERLLALFRSPYYAGSHVIWQVRGAAWVTTEIAAARRRWHRPDPAAEAAHRPEGAA